MKILYYSPASYGGIADYAHEQANALVKAGVDVFLLTTVDYRVGRGEQYKVIPTLQSPKPSNLLSHKLLKTLKGIGYVSVTLSNINELVSTIRQYSFQHVLLGSYSEYFAPLWVQPLQKLTQEGIIFGAVVHDPVRDFVLGPQWWHRWSVASGYSFLREAFVHQSIKLDTVDSMPQLRTTVIPQGPYSFPKATHSKVEMRARLNLPKNAPVMIAFGHIRANKNLDLVIKAMADVPEVYLIVAGNEMSSSHPLTPKYQALAEDLKVSDRIRWHIRHISDNEVSNFFTAADLVVLTYSRSFRSASAVLNTAAQYRKACIVSGGDGCLTSVIHRYNLGIWVEPDNSKAIALGLREWLSSLEKTSDNWAHYIRENSWERNADLTLKAFMR